ncbi:hypothetical protein EJC51_41385 [Streptomyces aquilus]|uniref:Uncharacterized protein n=1 Tax=Streptomyces aquilus TaxID=2548456 RepID=A0A3S9IC92_9ACTN|nr:hypothetical protein [Streptomyces aquilus]AZP21986.1 hypothetical protein EJC51_41385 [Streptomyces aquilus]
MEDLADEVSFVPDAGRDIAQIFIRCPGHLCGDEKFGQIGGAGRLAGDARSGIENRLWATAAPAQNPAMPTTHHALLPLTAAATPVRFQQQTGRPEGPTPPAS